MANYATLKAAIADVIKINGNNEITGAILQSALLAMIDSLGAGYQFAGVATPSTNPGTPDQNVFYLAGTAGTYTNFGGLVVENEAAILKYNGSWTREYTGIKLVTVSQNTDAGCFEINVGSDTYPVASAKIGGVFYSDSVPENERVKVTTDDGFEITSAEFSDKEFGNDEIVFTDDSETEEYAKINKDGIWGKSFLTTEDGVEKNILDFIPSSLVKMYIDKHNIAVNLPYDSTDGNHDMSVNNDVFVFFSDIHASENNLKRIISLANSWNDLNIAAILNGGDVVGGLEDESITWFTNLIATANMDFLSAIGNHDAWTGSNWNWDTAVNLYSKWMTTLKGTNIVFPSNAQANGYCYYYKDYTNCRVIVLNSGYYWDSTQASWLQSVLSEARTNGKPVLIMQHYPYRGGTSLSENPALNKAVPVDCTFTQKTIPLIVDSATNTLNVEVLSIVQDFIDAGGKFVCYICGHTHYDGFYKHEDYPDQYMFITGSAAYYKYYHEIKSADPNNTLYDQFNLFSVSSGKGLLKIVRIGANSGTECESKNVLCFDYINKTIINNY